MCDIKKKKKKPSLSLHVKKVKQQKTTFASAESGPFLEGGRVLFLSGLSPSITFF